MATPEGTLGPFYPGIFSLQQMPRDLSVTGPLLAHRPHGQRVRIRGRFVDAHGKPVPSLIIEFWQANAFGHYRHPEEKADGLLDPQFDGFARLRTSDDGCYEFNTVKPGAHPVPGSSGLWRAPHLRLTIFASGIDRLVTQMFFPDEPLNAADPILNSVPDPVVRKRLVAAQTEGGGPPDVLEYIFDVVLRGTQETPFFEDWGL